jgi:hypothetical protein
MNNILRDVKWRSHWLGLVIFLLGMVLLIYSIWQRQKAKIALERAPLEYRAQQEINTAAEEQSRILDSYIATYWQLRDRGVIGEAQRLILLETMQKMATDYELPELQFVLGISQPVTMETNPYWDAEIPMRVVLLRLDMKLLHEGQLYALLEGLKKEAPGILSINECNLFYDKQTGGDDAIQAANFRGSCELNWFAIVDGIANWSMQPSINLPIAKNRLSVPYLEGRLFTTEEERRRIESLSGQKIIAAVSQSLTEETKTQSSASAAKDKKDSTKTIAKKSKTVRFSGYIQGPDGQFHEWVDGRSDLTAGKKILEFTSSVKKSP